MKLMLEDVASNSTIQKKKAYAYMERVLTGHDYPLSERHAHPGLPSRKHYDARRDGAVLTPEEQVDTLLAIATDPNILVRQWIGLKPWI